MKQNDVPVFDLYSATKPHVGLLLHKDNTHFSKVANEKVIGPHVTRALKSFIDTGSLPSAKVTASLPIPNNVISTLEKDRDLGHPKHRSKKKK